MPEEYAFRVVAIDEQDGQTVREFTVYATDRDAAEKKYLHGDRTLGPQLDPEPEPFFDSNRIEYIKCIEPYGLEDQSFAMPPSYYEAADRMAAETQAHFDARAAADPTQENIDRAERQRASWAEVQARRADAKRY